MNKNNTVMIVQRIFAEYKRAFFDKVAEFYPLLLVHSENSSGINQTATAYSHKTGSVKLGKKETNVYLKVNSLIRKYKPHVIVHEFALGIISLPFTLLLAKLMGSKVVLWSHGYDRKIGFHPEKSLSDKIRIFYMKRADAVLLYGQNDRKLLAQYINPQKLFVAQNTMNTTYYQNLRIKMEEEGREIVKQRLGFRQKYNLIFIGRMIALKKPELLLELFRQIQPALGAELGVHFVGNGEMIETLKADVAKNRWEDFFYFHGAVYDEIKSGELLFASDLMVMPENLGLAINHAFCFACPVVSFKSGPHGPFHGPEEEYLVNEKTGFFIENNDIDAMAQAIISYLNNETMQRTIKKNIHYTINNVCSIDTMVAGFRECIEYVNNK